MSDAPAWTQTGGGHVPFSTYLQEINAPTGWTWTVPAGVTIARIRITGPGGGGGGGGSSNVGGTTQAGGTGGAAGSVHEITVPVTPGDVWTTSGTMHGGVGGAGAAAGGNNGTNGHLGGGGGFTSTTGAEIDWDTGKGGAGGAANSNVTPGAPLWGQRANVLASAYPTSPALLVPGSGGICGHLQEAPDGVCCAFGGAGGDFSNGAGLGGGAGSSSQLLGGQPSALGNSSKTNVSGNANGDAGQAATSPGCGGGGGGGGDNGGTGGAGGMGAPGMIEIWY